MSPTKIAANLADIVLKNGSVVDPLREGIERKDLSVKDGKIFSFHALPAKEEIDISNLCVSPGFIDSHLHVEGFHLLPHVYSQALLAHGTTTIVTDLHEIANAGGISGVEWYLKQLDAVPLDVFVMAPSCVPSCRFERGSGRLGIQELARLARHKRVIGLGEMMDIDGVLRRNASVMRKIRLFAGKPIDGHAPLLSGETLRVYLAAGIHSDHETTNVQEGREKLTYGMFLFLRQGSVAKDLDHLLPLIKPRFCEQLSLCTDDLSAHDLLEHGHMDSIIRLLVRRGVPLPRALRLATINPAGYFNLSDRKGIGIGKKADLAIFDPSGMRVHITIKEGRIVFRHGETVHGAPRSLQVHRSNMKIAHYSLDDLRQKTAGSRINIIGISEGSIVSEHLVDQARIDHGYLIADNRRDILYAFAFDRYRGTRRYGFGFVKGFGMKNGAVGSTYAHDSHNLIIIGDNLVDVYTVLTALEAEHGGMALARRGELLEHIPMPFYGIISGLDAHEFVQRENRMRKTMKRMGVTLANPLLQMSFLSLPVIPALRLTTQGLFDVTRQRHIPASCAPAHV